jgi:hypothetical protein
MTMQAHILEIRAAQQPPPLRYRPFPVEVLPDPLGSFVLVVSHAIGCDAAYVALPALAAIAACVGTSRRVQLKPGWTEPCIVWSCIVGESGSMKSPAFGAVMRPLRVIQDAHMAEAVRCGTAR